MIFMLEIQVMLGDETAINCKRYTLTALGKQGIFPFNLHINLHTTIPPPPKI